MEDISSAFSSFLSADNEIRREAESFLIHNIVEDPLFYQKLFGLFPEVPLIQQKLILIIIKNIVLRKFSFISDSFIDFSQQLKSIIQITNDTDLFIKLADIICQIAPKCDEVWPDFQEYATLYQTEPDFLPLSFYIFLISTRDASLFSNYKDFLRSILSDIILHGLKFSDLRIQIASTSMLIKFTKKINSEENAEKFKLFFETLYSIAENSGDFAEEDFDLLWTHLCNLNPYFSEPFYILDRLFLNQKECSPHTKSILLHFIFKNLRYVDQEEIGDLIHSFLMLQFEVEDIDTTGINFYCLYEYDAQTTYAYLKENFINLLSSSDQRQQEIAICLLKSFYIYYSDVFSADTSGFIKLVLSIDRTLENLLSIMSFIKVLNSINSEDSDIIFNFLIDIIVNYPNTDIQYQCLSVFSNLTKNPLFFEKLIEIQPYIQCETIPIYFSLLFQTYQVGTNLTNIKYDSFFDSIIEFYTKASESTGELISKFESNQESFDEYDSLYSSFLLLGSSSNCIIYFNYFLPYKFKDIIKPAFDSIFNIFRYKLIFKERLDDIYDNEFDTVETDFFDIIRFTKSVYLDNIREYYDFLSSRQEINQLKYILLYYDGDKCPFSNQIIDNFINKGRAFINSKIPLINICSFIVSTMIPLSRSLYKFPNEDLSSCYLSFLNVFLDTVGKYSSEIVQYIVDILRTLISQKRIRYYQENNIEWYQNLIDQVISLSQYTLNEIIIGNNNEKKILSSFIELSHLMSLFVNLNLDYGHEFFEQFLIPSYQSNPEIYVERLLLNFCEMLEKEYCNENELSIISQIVESYTKENTNYNDIRCYLFEVITRLSKIDTEINSQYFQFAMEQFNETRDDIKKNSPRLSISIFLLNALNSDTEKFSAVLEILPEILSYFPYNERPYFNLFFNELQILSGYCPILSQEIIEAFIAAIARFFSYLTNASIIFKASDEQCNILLQILKGLLDGYIGEIPDATYNSIISIALPDMPCSVEYVLSLLQ